MCSCPARNTGSTEIPDFIFDKHVCKYSSNHLNAYIISDFYLTASSKASPKYYIIPI